MTILSFQERRSTYIGINNNNNNNNRAINGLCVRLGEAQNSRKDEASKTSSTPNEKHFNTQIGSFDSVQTSSAWIDEVWSCIADTKVP